MIQARQLLCAASVLTILAFSIGCDAAPENPPTYPVTGTVTYRGKPVPQATVVLMSLTSGGRGASGTTDESGKFELMTFEPGDGALPGEYKVRVSAYELVAEPPNDSDQTDLTQEEEEALYTGAEDEEPSKNLLPKKYENAATSGLSHTVTEGPTVLDLDLK